MFHVYEGPSTLQSDRFIVISDEEWVTLPTEEQVRYRQRQGGFRTALDAVIHMLDAREHGRVKEGETGQAAERNRLAFSDQEMPLSTIDRAIVQLVTA